MSEQHQDEVAPSNRREFLRRAGLLGGMGAAAVALRSTAASATTPPTNGSLDLPAKVAALGDPYVTVDATPVLRLWDTRSDGYGKLGPGGIRNVITPDFYVNIDGVIINVTITETEGSGFLSVYPKGPTPRTSTINWYETGQVAANSTQLFLSGGPSNWNIDVYCGGGGRTHFIIDEIAYLARVSV